MSTEGWKISRSSRLVIEGKRTSEQADILDKPSAANVVSPSLFRDLLKTEEDHVLEASHKAEKRKDFLELVRDILGSSVTSGKLELIDPELQPPNNQLGNFSSTLFAQYKVEISNGAEGRRPNIAVFVSNDISEPAEFALLVHVTEVLFVDSDNSNATFVDLQGNRRGVLSVGDKVKLVSRYGSSVERDLPPVMEGYDEP